MTCREFDGSGCLRSPLDSEIGSTMPHGAFGSWTLRSIAGLVLLTTGAVGAHSSGAETIHFSHTMVESSNCRGNHDGDDDHEDRGHDDRGHDSRGRGGDDHGGHGHDDHGHDGASHSSGMLQQEITVRVPSTAFLRVDKKGHVTAAATNTGCQPSKEDDVFLLRPNGAIERTTAIHADDCYWRGDFSIAGRFQPQDCRADQHDGHGK
jgi:hypothetical protein